MVSPTTVLRSAPGTPSDYSVADPFADAAVAVAPAADTVEFAFTANGPWVVVEADMPWRNGLDEVREATRRQVPELTTPGTIPPGRRLLRTAHILGTALGMWRLKEKPDRKSVV